MKLGTSFVLSAPMPSRNKMHDVSFVSGSGKREKYWQYMIY
jgi:hypothetical protein